MMNHTSNLLRLLIVCTTCCLAVACSDPESSNNGQNNGGQACDSDFDCPLPLQCGADGFCVDTGGNNDTDAGDTSSPEDTGPSDTGTEDTGSDDTGSDDTGTTDTGSDDTGVDDTGATDTGATDTGADTGTTDTGADTGQDTGMTDTGADTGQDTGMDAGDTAFDTGQDAADTGTDTGPDSGPGNFSGCASNLDCDAYQSCNTSLGRCEDMRPACSVDSDCTGGGFCVAGRCAPSCSSSADCDGGLNCFSLDDSGTVGACLAFCGTANSGTSYSCGPDTQCLPLAGIGEGLCRGVGTNATGDSCTDDYSADDCESGSYCLDDRGTKTCRSFCSASGSPGCATGEFCRILFPDDEDATNSTGVCEVDCGGLGNTDDSLCSGGEVCQPNSANDGFCTTQGSVAEDGTCYYDGTGYCEVGLSCAPAGPDAPTDATEGRCTPYCDPTATQGFCDSSEDCIPFLDTPDFGACRTTCNPSEMATDNACGTARPRCLSSDESGVPGYCSIAGGLSIGDACELGSPLSCGPDDLCVIPNDSTEPYGGGSTGSGQCTRYCESFQYSTNVTTRCGTSEVCASRYLSLGLGFCTTNKTSPALGRGDSCTSAQEGQWCDDDILCLDWDQTGSPRCEIPCDTSVSGTCPSGTSCLATSSSGTAGYCG